MNFFFGLKEFRIDSRIICLKRNTKKLIYLICFITKKKKKKNILANDELRLI